jgi:hypothetical protein
VRSRIAVHTESRDQTWWGMRTFSPPFLTDDPNHRNEYFEACATRFAGCDLVFFDPDNGMEVKSVSRGLRNSCKYLFWDEVCKTFATGSSVLIYQHFPREKRDAYIHCMVGHLRRRTHAATVFSYRTP